MRILICDDEADQLNRLKVHVEEYMKSHYLNPETVVTQDPNEILNNDSAFDLVFLDIMMPGIDGISVAKELKRRNGKTVFFFVTAFGIYQDEAMDLQAFRFFEKPFDVRRLYAGLDKALKHIDETYVDIYFSENGVHRQVSVDDIVYIELTGRKIAVHLNNGEVCKSRAVPNNFIYTLPNTFFRHVHKSFIINMHYITKYSYKEVYLKDEIRVPIASRNQANFHKYWLEYVRRRN